LKRLCNTFLIDRAVLISISSAKLKAIFLFLVQTIFLPFYGISIEKLWKNHLSHVILSIGEREESGRAVPMTTLRLSITVRTLERGILRMKGDTCVSYYILVIQKTMPEELTFVEVILHEKLYVLILVRDCLQTFQIIQTFKPDCFLLEENLPTTGGRQLCADLQAQQGLEDVPILIFESCHTAVEHESSIQSPGKAILRIPQLELLLETISKMLFF